MAKITEFITTTDKETSNLGKKLGKTLRSGLLCLYGDLGVGKTTFVQGLGKSLGIIGRIQSPTFTFQRIYKGKKKLYHFDCYRASSPDVLSLSEVSEALEKKDGIVVIEWAEHLKGFLPEKRIDISFSYLPNNHRHIILTTHD